MNSIIQNLQTAREVISAAPEESFDLDKFAQHTTCGTLYCSLGWLAASGRFSEHMELQWDLPIIDDYMQRQQEDPAVAAFYTSKFANVVPPGGGGTIGDSVLDELFGRDSFAVLFSTREHGRFDGGWDKMKIRSDRDLALWRLDRQLEIVELLNTPEVAAIVEQHQPDDEYYFRPMAEFPEPGKIVWVISIDVMFAEGDEASTGRKLVDLADRALSALGRRARYSIIDGGGFLNLILKIEAA